MFQAIGKVIAQLGDRAIVRLLLWSALLAVAVFVLLFVAVGWLLANTTVTDIAALETAVDVLGGLATLVLTWFLFPAVLTMFVGMFLDPVAAAVERRHFPGLPPAAGTGFFAGLGAALRLLLTTLLLNVLLLVLLLIPFVYLPAFLLVNGYLFGREYCEMVALRRLDPAATKLLRSRHGGELLLIGGLIAFGFTLPFVNLLTPVLGTMLMVHRVHAWVAAGVR